MKAKAGYDFALVAVKRLFQHSGRAYAAVAHGSMLLKNNIKHCNDKVKATERMNAGSQNRLKCRSLNQGIHTLSLQKL